MWSTTTPSTALSGPNSLRPSCLNGRDRLAEIAKILAIGLVRLRARQSSRQSAPLANSSVDFRAAESVCRDHSQGEFR
ncbi:MAG: hypothetical protein E5W92_25920 [Mesorhizobium sp.]|nr:MAG: hypothetical protein E5W92_25920 [Mesorhizobium sp.]